MLKHSLWSIFFAGSTIILLFISAACHRTEEKCLSIAFTGDVLLDRGVREQIKRKGTDELFSSVAVLFRSMDATIINLECPVTSTESPIHKKYIFRADPDNISALSRAGITHAALANNHSIDQGRSGLTDTYRHLRSSGIIPIGYGDSAATSGKPVIISKGDIKVGILNSLLLPLENWVYLDNSPGICQYTIEKLEAAIKKLKCEHPQMYVVVILHWGIEYQTTPSFSQRKGAYRLIRAGADAIIGHHPHVLQEMEYFDGKPIFYSLGNFVFDQRKPETSRSEIIQLDFSSSGYSVRRHPVIINKCKPLLQ